MNREELRELMEPFTIEFKNDPTKIPDVRIAQLARRWIDEGEHMDIDDAFNIWNKVMAELVIKHDIKGRINN